MKSEHADQHWSIAGRASKKRNRSGAGARTPISFYHSHYLEIIYHGISFLLFPLTRLRAKKRKKQVTITDIKLDEVIDDVPPVCICGGTGDTDSSEGPEC